MGDRANVCIVQHKPGGRSRPADVFLYPHIGGSDLPIVCRNGLERGRGVWDDEAALAGMIFIERLRRDMAGSGGLGISTYLYEDDHDVLVVGCRKRTGGLAEAQTETPLRVHRAGRFEEYWQFTKDELWGLEAR